MPYSEGRVVHDADAHLMETPTWLRDHAEPAFRDRLPVLRYPGRQRAAPDRRPRRAAARPGAAFERAPGPARLGRVPRRRRGRDHAAQELRRHRVVHRRGPAPSTGPPRLLQPTGLQHLPQRPAARPRARRRRRPRLRGGPGPQPGHARVLLGRPPPPGLAATCRWSTRRRRRRPPRTPSTQGAAALLVASGCPPRYSPSHTRPLRGLGPGPGGGHPRRLPRRRDRAT